MNRVLPIIGGSEREVALGVPILGIVTEDPYGHAHHGDTLVVPRPPYVRDVALESRRLAHSFEVGRPTVGAPATVVEDA